MFTQGYTEFVSTKRYHFFEEKFYAERFMLFNNIDGNLLFFRASFPKKKKKNTLKILNDIKKIKNMILTKTNYFLLKQNIFRLWQPVPFTKDVNKKKAIELDK